MNADGHSYFPIHWWDTHCHQTFELEAAAKHIQRIHSTCLSCGAERLLCLALLQDAEIAAVAYVDGERVS